MNFKTKHLETGEELSSSEITGLIDYAIQLKKDRSLGKNLPYLTGQNLALLFDKPSLRTRFSFTIAMTELGGYCIESLSSTRKKEEPEDLARVLNGYCHGIVVRTHDDETIRKMISKSHIPIINGLSELHHPCQILADFMTLKEVYGNLKGLKLSYIGDGNNILHSLLLLCPMVGIHLQYACPPDFGPNPDIVQRAVARASDYQTRIEPHSKPENAVLEAQAVYTDVWTSMGFEEEKQKRENAFSGYQVNERLLGFASPGAVVMHCLPMERGHEISETLPENDSSVIFQQSENRLHVQKALLIGLLSKRK